MMAENPINGKEAHIEGLDEAFERHGKYAEQAKKEYDEIFERLIGRLSASHLEPFAKVLLERESIAFNTETSISSLKQCLRALICDRWDDAWKEHIAANVTKLEMLKEHFKEFEGTDWKIREKSVKERTLPLRLEFKFKRLDWLQKQVEHQRQRLEKTIEEVVQNRLLIQRTSEESIKLTEYINNFDTESKKMEMKKMFNELLSISDWNSTND